MNCEKCGHELEMHYVTFCPKCDTKILTMNNKVIGDLFKIMCHMEANGYMKQDDFWDWFTDSYDFSNDTYVELGIDDSYDDEELNKYMRKLSDLLHVEMGDYVLMWVSW